jgi:hypothetical protein
MYNIISADVERPVQSAFEVVHTPEGLRFTGLKAGDHDVTVMDIVGRTLLEKTIDSNILQLPALSTGTYFVRIGDHVVAITM